MKASELIKELQSMIEKHGDLWVHDFDARYMTLWDLDKILHEKGKEDISPYFYFSWNQISWGKIDV